jgi:hypothetical protein
VDFVPRLSLLSARESEGIALIVRLKYFWGYLDGPADPVPQNRAFSKDLVVVVIPK